MKLLSYEFSLRFLLNQVLITCEERKRKIIAWDRHSDPTKRIEGKAQNKNTSPYSLNHTHNNYIDKIRKNYVFFL